MKQYETDNLTSDQVLDRTELVSNHQSIDELYCFGSMLLSETRERKSRLESKATNVLVWSMAFVAFIFSRVDSGKFSFNSGARIPSVFALVAAVAAMVSIVFSWMVVRVGYGPIVGDEHWFPSEDINNPEELKLYHVRVMHTAKTNSEQSANSKGIWLYRAQTFMAISGIFLAVAVMLYLWVSYNSAALPHR